jgi:hypothetical protein
LPIENFSNVSAGSTAKKARRDGSPTQLRHDPAEIQALSARVHLRSHDTVGVVNVQMVQEHGPIDTRIERDSKDHSSGPLFPPITASSRITMF